MPADTSAGKSSDVSPERESSELDICLCVPVLIMILPRFDGVAKGGIYYSIKGEQDGEATENLHAGVQSGGGPLVKSSGKPLSQIARELGISDSALSKWCKQLADQGEQAFPGSGHQSAEQEEIRRLRRELEVTRQERDIVKPWGQ